jgi:hypothetical protein
MKTNLIRLIAVFLISILIISCHGDDKKIPTDVVKNPRTASGSVSSNVPQITFTKAEHDFGRLIQGEQVVHVFKFSNTGSADLLISKVSASCGCTASKYTKEPVKPGQEGKVEVTFDSNGQRGIQNKTISVLTNGTPQTTILRVKAQVVTPESY